MSTMLEAELLVHLDAQLASARRLLDSSWPRARRSAPATSTACSRRLAEIQTEMVRRGALEQDRAELLAARRRGARRPRHRRHARAPDALITPGAAQRVRERSAELRGLLAEIAREHGINRALMRQELAFLSTSRGCSARRPRPATGPAGAQPAPPRRRRRRTAPWTCRPAMAISTFYGLETSLRGLLAQQRRWTPPATTSPTLDTPGYSRQQAVLAASTGADVAAGAAQHRRRQLGPGVDVTATARPRPVPRPPVPRAEHRAAAERTAQADGARPGRDRARRARRQRHLAS